VRDEIGHTMLRTKRYVTFEIVDAAGIVSAEFEGFRLANKALPGDFVKAADSGEGCELVKRRAHPPLVGILEFTNTMKFGYTSRGIPIYRFIPHDTSYPSFLVGSKEKYTDNQLAIVRFDEWTTTTFPRGALQEILGPCGVESLELQALALQYSPWEWTRKRCPANLVLPELGGRRAISATTINIDPPGCRDIDDVLSLWQNSDSTWTLAISIADVAELLRLNPELHFAAQIGQTLYEEGRAVRPLFETGITESILSLEADGITRPAVTLFATWNGSSLSGYEWCETVVQTTRSYTYEDCGNYEHVDVLKAIASHILGFPTPDSHKWIEALMLLYNSKAAEVLKSRGEGILRIHSEPDVAKLERYKYIGLPAEELAYPAAVYCSATSPEAGRGHWGLQYGSYCHASSPIRRFADCVNQTILKAAIRNHPTPQLPQSIEAYADSLNCLGKLAKKYERDVFLVKKILSKYASTQLEGIIADVGKVYVYEWKRIVSVEEAIIPGTEVNVEYYVNTKERSWKSRILFALR
jgi:exoribonuclease R